MTDETGRRAFHTLDAMRGIAAFSVALGHTQNLLGGQFFPKAYLAVDFFYALSGFVICFAYEERLRNGLTVGRFLIMRLIRLYPLYLLGLLAGLMVAGSGMILGGSSFWTPPLLAWSTFFSLLMLPTLPVFGALFLFPLNLPAWSLFSEILVNAAYAMIGWLGRNDRVLLGLFLAGALGELAAIAHYGSLNAGFTWDSAPAALPRVVTSFTAGVLAYRVRGRLRLPVFPPVALLAIVMLCFMIAPPAGRWDQLYDWAMAALVMPALVPLGALAEPGPRWRPIFTELGIISYALYILHAPMLRFIENGLERVARVDVAAFAPWIGIASVLLIALAGSLAHRLYDVPARAWLNRLWRGAAPPRARAITG